MTPASPTIVFTEGILRVTVYDLAPGEGLPEHEHGPEATHITIVATGAVTVNGVNLPAGKCIAFGVDEPHEIVGEASPTSRIFNIVTGTG